MYLLASSLHRWLGGCIIGCSETKLIQRKSKQMNAIDWDFLSWIEGKSAEELWQDAQQLTQAERLALYSFLTEQLTINS